MIVLVTGTGTEVGKTWVTAATTRALRGAGVAVAARKPVQSYDPDAPEPTDAEVLADATGEDATTVCPAHRWLPVPLAPPMAADVLGRPAWTIEELAAETGPGGGPGVLTFVEGAGGLRSPLADDGDTLTFSDALAPAAVVLVADAGLGTINLVRMSADALGPHPPLVVYLNRFEPSDEVHRRNRDWLVTREGLEVVTDPEALATWLRARA